MHAIGIDLVGLREMALTADHLVVVGTGRLLADVSVAEMLATTGAGSVRVVTLFATELRDRGQVVVLAYETRVVRPSRSSPG